MGSIRRVVLDVMKPHDPELVGFTEHLSAVESVDAVTATLVERDKEVQEVVVTLEGDTLDFNAIEVAIEELGGAVHSVDEVARGNRIAEPGRIHKDG